LSLFLEIAASDEQLVKQVPQFLFCEFLVERLSFADLLIQSVREHVKDELFSYNKKYMDFLFAATEILMLGLLNFRQE
jgi:hypothetical protein